MLSQDRPRPWSLLDLPRQHAVAEVAVESWPGRGLACQEWGPVEGPAEALAEDLAVDTAVHLTAVGPAPQ